MSARRIIVVDVETNGLDPNRHQAVEVAWCDLDTFERGGFVPAHDVSRVLAAASVEALRVNRYIDRLATAPQDDNGEGLRDLFAKLRDATLAGSNPSFDAAMLRKLFAAATGTAAAVMRARPAPWHHRMWDLSAYAAGVLGLDELPGLAKVCELLDVKPPDHSASGDVDATTACFLALRSLAAPRAVTP